MGDCKYSTDIGMPEHRCVVKCMHNDYYPKRLAYEEIVKIMNELNIDLHKSIFFDFAHAIMDEIEKAANNESNTIK